jgi:16S rRNA (guanine1207-N2)-methyltransferase
MNGVENFTVETGDCLDAYQDQKFDAVISNPPTHQGEGVTRKLFQQAYHCLNKGGEFWLVYNQDMKYEEKLADQFEAVNEVAQEGNFKVVRAEK